MRDGSGHTGAWRGLRTWSIVGVLVAPLLAGCVTEAEHRPQGVTIAFESIDGPPRTVFERLVTQLGAEAQTRRIAVVSRRMPARYRVRAYLAAKVERSRTTIAWVWDVYDSDLRRATRFAGEEAIGRRGAEGWAAADELVLGRIVDAGLTQFAAFAAKSTEPSDSSPAERVPEAPANPPGAPPAGDIQVASVAP